MKKRFLLLPAKGLVARFSENSNVNPEVTNFLVQLSGSRSAGTGAKKLATRRLPKPLPLDVLDSVHEDGVKLVEMDTENISELQMAFPGLRVVPEVFFHKAIAPRKFIAPTIKKLSQGKKIMLTVTGSDGKKVAKADVVLFSDFKNGIGTQGKTSASGTVTLSVPRTMKKIDRLYIYPGTDYWPLLKKNIAVSGTNVEISLQKIVVPYKDVIRTIYEKLPALNGTLKVAVIDTGVGPHNELKVFGGECTVEGDKPTDHSDYDGHGTHVAGIISSFGKTAHNAPGIELYSYRVFPKNGKGASNFSIVKAIDRAVANGCVLINMSLGGGDEDDGIKDAISDAHSKGVICFVATGNDDRSPVSFPANYSLSIAVSAMGRKGTFPKDTEPADCIASPYGKENKNDFVASFSNIGPEVAVIAPGVGIVSCAPSNKYAVMNGTSMACPAATGIAARLLVQEGTIINLPPTSKRSDEMIKFLGTKMKSLGFAKLFEGRGMMS